MTDCLQSKSSNKLEPIVTNNKGKFRKHLISSSQKDLPQWSLHHWTLMDRVILGNGPLVDIGIFLLKVAALDIVRRFSKARCPFVWDGLQTLQLFCYPPFKWIQRWDPFKGVVKCMQTLSRPLLVLSIATTISDLVHTSKPSDDDPANNTRDNTTEPQLEPLTSQSTPDSRFSDEIPENSASERWLLQLHKELDKQGLSLPERINDDELRRFYVASNCDFSTFVSSIKKTIRWRQSYALLPQEELKVWSHLLFWHGRDVRNQPCLVIRLGRACFELTPNNKPCFAQAIVSQVEHAVLHLVDAENPQITVLMDCERLSPFKFPMHMMRSIAILLQDHYPNRLACLLVVRLPPIARVIIQTLTQVLKPVTRKKLKIIGDRNYHKALSKYLLNLPSFLDGQCSCVNCSGVIDVQDTNNEQEVIIRTQENLVSPTEEEDASSTFSYDIDTSEAVSCNQVLRTALIGVLMVWIFIALIVVLHDP